jgi:uncharacterized membrane protein
MFRIRALILFAPLALVGCGRDASQVPPPPPAPPPNKIDISHPITARGTEPFWALAIEGARLTLTRPEQPPLVGTATKPEVEPGKVRWKAATDANHAFTVTLYSSYCSDGMSDIRYPFNAEVDIGTRVLHGCAAKTADLNKKG